jgi:alcohol dehydrogenase
MRSREPDNPALGKYARVAAVLDGSACIDPEGGPERLVTFLRDWTSRLEIPRLESYGVREGDVPRIVDDCRGSSMQTNPLVLEDAELAALVVERL